MTNEFSTSIVKMTIDECQSDTKSIFSNDDQTYTLTLNTKDKEPNTSKLTLTEQQQHELFKYVDQKAEVFLLTQHVDKETVHQDIIYNNQSLLEKNIDNVKYINSVIDAQTTSHFNRNEYEYIYKNFEIVYNTMNYLSKENVETVYLYLTALANQKNGQRAIKGTEAVIRNTVAFALRNDLTFEELLNLFDLTHSQNITARYAEIDDEESNKEKFFTTLLKAKSEHELSNEDIYRHYSNLYTEIKEDGEDDANA